MTTYIYCSTRSIGALELVKALGYPRLRRFDGLDFWNGSKRFSLTPGDAVVCWGTQLGDLDDVKVLNGAPFPQNKNKLLNLLANSGNYVIATHPQNMINWKKAPKKYLPRLFGAKHAADLINPPTYADYVSVRDNIVSEYRLHSFCGKIIKAGEKVIRDGFTPVPEEQWVPNANLAHPWIRTYETGWRVKYEGYEPNDLQRRITYSALTALGLHFGVVDLGITDNELDGGQLTKVIDVSATPILDETTIGLYAGAIKNWVVPPEKEAVTEKALELKKQIKAKRLANKDQLLNRLLNQGHGARIPVPNVIVPNRMYAGRGVGVPAQANAPGVVQGPQPAVNPDNNNPFHMWFVNPNDGGQ